MAQLLSGIKIATKVEERPDSNRRVLIKKGPVDTSLKELEDNYQTKSEWKMIEDGGVISIPVLRMQNPPAPDSSGQLFLQEMPSREI